jgi:hypothetical protein
MELPMRHSLKQYFPLFYKEFKSGTKEIADVFENIIQKISAEYCAQFRKVSRITNFSCDAKNIKIFPLFILLG